MDRTKKHAFVEDLSGKLSGAAFVYVTDFAGLDVERMTLLRSRLRAAQVEYVVVKNTLARRAIEGTAAAALVELLEGPSAFALSDGDAVAAAKVLTDFAREGDRPRIKGGVVAGRMLGLEEIRRLATLPPREVLLGQLLGGMRAPVGGFVYVLAGLLSKFVRTVDAVRARREEQGETAPPSAPEAPAAVQASAASEASPAEASAAPEAPAAAEASAAPEAPAGTEPAAAAEPAPETPPPAEASAAPEPAPQAAPEEGTPG